MHMSQGPQDPQGAGLDALLDRLVALAPGQRSLRLVNDPRVTSGLAGRRWFAEGPRSNRGVSLREALVGVDLVRAAASAPPAMRAELEALAYLDLSHAHALLSDERSSDEAFENALQAIDTLESNAGLEALLLEERAEQLAQRQDFRGALRFADRALRLRAETGDLENTLSGLRRRARLLWRVGEHAAAINAAKDALAATPHDGDSDGTTWAHVELAEFLCEAGAPQEALRVLDDRHPDAPTGGELVARWRAIEGLAARNVGSFQRAERCLRRAVREWLDLGRAREAAQATCELSLLLYEQGRGSEIASLAQNLRSSTREEIGSTVALRLVEATDEGAPSLPLLRALEVELRRLS